MDNFDENYFSIYMKKKENKMKKSSSGKSNKTLKITNISNLYLPKDQSLKNLIFCSSGKKKCSMSFIKNKLSEKNNIKEPIILSNNYDDDNDKKIDMLEKRIFEILELIDNFMNKYIKKEENNSQKKIIEIKNKNSEKRKEYNKKLSYKTNSEKNILTYFMTNNNNFLLDNNNIRKKLNIRNRNSNKKNFYQKSNSQFFNSEKKFKEKINQRKTDYGNLISRNFLKKTKKISQSQVFINKNIIYSSPERKKINNKITFELGSDNSSTREISEKLFVGNKKNKNKNIYNSNINIIQGIKINNFNKNFQDKNNRNKCMSERSKKYTNITKRYKLDFEN